MYSKRPLLFAGIILLLSSIAGMAQTDTAAIAKMSDHARKLRYSDLDSSLLMTNQVISALESIPASQPLATHWKEKLLIRSYYFQGMLYYEKGENTRAFDGLNKSLKIAESINDQNGKASVYGGLAIVHNVLGDLTKALEYNYKSLKIHEALGNKAGIAARLSNIGNVYSMQGKHEKSLEFYQRALKVAEETKDPNSIGHQHGNIGSAYHFLKHYDKALEHYLKAMELCLETDNKTGYAQQLNNIAGVYASMEKYPMALDYYKRLEGLLEEIDDISTTLTCLGNMGVVYFYMNDLKKAEDYLVKAIKMCEESGDVESIAEFEPTLSDIYAKKGNYKLALEHYKKHVGAKDTLFNTQNAENNVRMEMNYEFEKKQAVEKAVHQEEVFRLETENKVQKQQRVFLFAFLGLALLLLFFARRAYINKKKNAEFMAAESQRKEVLLQEVHHRINNNLQVISSLLTLQANNLQDERLNEYLQQSQNRIQSLSVMHELLYQTDSFLEINMKEYLGKVLDFHKDVLVSKASDIKVNLDVNTIDLPTKVAVPIALIVNELVTNSLKYAFDKVNSGSINVSLQQNVSKKEEWILKVSDTGKGLPPETEMRRNSLGLRLVNLMTKQLNAILTKQNAPGASFTFQFSAQK
jgi:two-component system, sensor histidine kinase PdtaS